MTVRFIASAVIAALLLSGNPLATPQTPANPTQSPNKSSYLTQAQAEELALEHAQLAAGDVTGLVSYPDKDSRVREWEVEFRYGDWTYEYEIHAKTGAILEWEKDREPQKNSKPAQNIPATADPKPAEPAPEKPAQERISADEAKNLALAHAGLTRDQVSRLRAEFDYDDGVPEYEVEFYYDGWEYEYDIHGKTGKILSWDKDR